MKRVLLFILLLSTAAACTRPAPPTAESSGPAAARTEVVLSPTAQAQGQIETQPAATTDEPEVYRVSGHIVLADNRTWRVGVRANGIVVSVRIGAGDFVHKGAVLARYRADELRDSRARYHAAKAELARAQSGATLAERNLERMGTLYELKAASQQQVDEARQDAVAAQSGAGGAQSEVDRLRGLMEDDLHVAAEPKPGDENPDDVPILAPADGYILEKNVTLGKAIDTTDDTFVIGDLSQVWMLASVRQEQLGPLRLGQPVRVTVTGVSEQQFEGKITNLGQSLEPQTRTMQVRIVLDNSKNLLRPEMLATAEIPVGGPRTIVIVPSGAVQQMDGQDVVFVRTAPDRFAVRPVQTTTTRNGYTPILEGLKRGDPVVVRGSFILKSQLLRATLERGG